MTSTGGFDSSGAGPGGSLFAAETLYEERSFGPDDLAGSDPAGSEVADVDAEGSTFLDCTLRGLTVSAGSFERAVWRGGRAEGVRFIGVRMVRTEWLDWGFEDCLLSGAEFFGAQLRRVRWRGCLLDTVNLRGARLREVVFEDCTVRDLDLAGATVTDVRFPGCRIERLDLSQATLSRVDLRGARVHLRRGFDRLRGAVIDQGQLIDLAPDLAGHLGIDVRGPGRE